MLFSIPLMVSAHPPVAPQTTGTGGGINNVVEDITPQLGGDLDLNEKYIEQVETQITDADVATPDLVGGGTYFEFYDSTADVDTITGFSNFNADTTYWFRFEDAYWIIDFSGTNLKGHNGIDWEPIAGDAMACRSHDGTTIDCIISRASASGRICFSYSIRKPERSSCEI